MKLFKRQKNNGFTIIEALVAISILSISVAGMLGVTASTATTARYANNEIAANYLLQEAVDSIRNSRDTIVFQQKNTWTQFLNRYGYTGSNKCFSTYGCYLKIDIFNSQDLTGTDIVVCPASGCPYLSYDPSGNLHYFYYYDTVTTNLSSFNRTVTMSTDVAYPDQVKITVTVTWTNGSVLRSRSLDSYLLNWQK
jgi:prepilin-type N-terminal cleavage/methylation domain-containing protein